MLNIEIHLPSCTVEADVEPSLEMHGNSQFLVLKEKMSLDFLNQNRFKAFLESSMSQEDKASISLARKDAIINLKKQYMGDDAISSTRTQFIHMKSMYKLPFVCDDVFSLSDCDRYPGTLFEFFVYTIVDQDETQVNNNFQSVDAGGSNTLGAVKFSTDDDEELIDTVDKVKVYVVRLVAKEKNEERTFKQTPKKRRARVMIPREERL